MSTITLSELAKEFRELNVKVGRGINFEPLLNEVKQKYVEQTDMSFNRSVDPNEVPWAPVKRKVPPPILIKSGRLRRAAKDKSRAATVRKHQILVGKVQVPFYGWFHQKGTSRMPARRWHGIGQRLIAYAREEGKKMMRSLLMKRLRRGQ